MSIDRALRAPCAGRLHGKGNLGRTLPARGGVEGVGEDSDASGDGTPVHHRLQHPVSRSKKHPSPQSCRGSARCGRSGQQGRCCRSGERGAGLVHEGQVLASRRPTRVRGGGWIAPGLGHGPYGGTGPPINHTLPNRSVGHRPAEQWPGGASLGPCPAVGGQSVGPLRNGVRAHPQAPDPRVLPPPRQGVVCNPCAAGENGLRFSLIGERRGGGRGGAPPAPPARPPPPPPGPARPPQPENPFTRRTGDNPGAERWRPCIPALPACRHRPGGHRGRAAGRGSG